MIELLTIVNRVLAVAVALLPTMVWHWMTGRGHSRARTFFGVRVEQGFPESDAGAAIRKQFRQRLWVWSLAGTAASQLLPDGLAAATGSLASSLVGVAAFAIANRRTKRDAPRADGSPLRIARLVEEPEPWWLGGLDWLAMLVPPAVPAATLIFLALHWDQVPAGFRGAGRVFPIMFGLIAGLVCSVNQWALRFRARSSDWAPTPGASHQYRTYLGAMQAAVLAFIGCQLCVLAVMPLNGSIAWLRHFDMRTYFLVSFPAQALWLVCIWRLRFWLTSHMAVQSGDPMPDSCWKWGCVYFNRSDPALVVPLRTGVGQSFNCARPSVWMLGGAVVALSIASFVESAGLWLRMGHPPN